MTRLCITGGSGFVGAHLVEHFIKVTDWDIVVLDRLNYAGSLERLAHLRGPRLRFVFHDIRAAYPASVLHALDGTNFVIHAGAETHVDRSLVDPEPFVMSNVVGTMHTLDAARRLNVDAFVLVSTDEVHGPAPEGVHYREDAEIRPSNPYSAAKAGAEALTYAWWKSFKLPVIRVRSMNMLGERQHPEKFVPMCIRRITRGETVVVHGNPLHIGSRKWLHARNFAHALHFLLRCGGLGEYNPASLDECILYGGHRSLFGEMFHIAGEERTNLDIAQFVARVLEKPLNYELLDFHAVRLGHDSRYSLDDSKIRALGWSPPFDLDTSLRRTIEWSVRPENAQWLEV